MLDEEKDSYLEENIQSSPKPEQQGGKLVFMSLDPNYMLGQEI